MSKDRTERVELTVLCLMCRGEEILLQNRLDRTWGGWCMPGGHVERNESFCQAVKREMREETGLSVSDLRLCGVKHFPIERGRYLVLFYKALSFEGTLQSSKEGEMAWIPRAELSMLKKVPDFDEMLRIFDEDELSEFQYVTENTEDKVMIY